ncbi:hypothetical protein RhiirC2_854568 [Rhizophagus irregularis]|uniref:RRM domain-containing protein n=1 Tax=Rhizophagus irregularis TaxID=588596 RepID=A0A2N1MR21_9GLOM|nr:hypothetical protein RhiirC2_854568 [Rhizophagus irregularis]
MLEDSLEEPTHFNKLIEINLIGNFAFQYLKQNNPQGGIIINTASITAIYLVFTFGVYSATKAGVTSFTRSMAQVSELHNITINAVCSSVTIFNKVSIMAAGAVGVPDHWWSPIDDVAEAKVKWCVKYSYFILPVTKYFTYCYFITQYRASTYERPPFTPPGGPPTYGQTLRGGYTFGAPTQCTVYMAPRPGYGIPWGGISSMAAPDSEVEKLTTLFIGGISPGVTDDWMKKMLKTCSTLKSWKRAKDQSGNPKGFGFAEYADADADSVLRALRVLGGEGSGDDKKDEGVVLSALEEARERERQREEEERANRRAKAEKGNRERERERERERNRDRDRDRQYGNYRQLVNFVPTRKSRRESYILDDEEEEQRRHAKRKTEMEMAFREE